jgi:hypothetical protein
MIHELLLALSGYPGSIFTWNKRSGLQVRSGSERRNAGAGQPHLSARAGAPEGPRPRGPKSKGEGAQGRGAAGELGVKVREALSPVSSRLRSVSN